MAISYSPNDVFMVQRNAENTAFLETVLRSTPNSVVVFDPNSILVTVATKSFSDAMVSQALRDFTASVAAAAFISEFAISASNANFSNFAFSASSANLASFAFSASHLNPGANIYLSQSYIQSNVDASPPPFIPGILVWDNAHSTYAIDTDIPGLELQIGQEEFVRVVAGEFIPSGSVVYINGSVSSFLSGSDVYISSSVVYISGSISGSISDFISSSFSGSEIYISGSDVYISGSINDFISSSISSSFSSSFSGSEVYISGSISGSLIYISGSISGSSIYISSFITSSISGSIVGFPQVYRAIADGTGLKSSAIGIASIDISASSQGFITSNGNVENLDTSLFNAGDEIYLSNTVLGGYQSTFPEDPYEKVSLGHVTFADPAFGKILVNISILPTLNSPYVGMTSVPSFVDNGNQTFTVGSAVANFSITSDGLGQIKSYTIPSRTISALVGDFSQYVFATFNNGNPTYILGTNFALADQIQTFPVFSVILLRSILIGGRMTWASWGSPGVLLPNKQLSRIIDIYGISRVRGLILSTSGSYINVTSGSAWQGVNNINLPQINTSDAAGSPLSLYFHSSGSWNVTTINSGQYINNQYDNGIDLQTLQSGSFVNNYIYRMVGQGANNGSVIILSDRFDSSSSMDISVPTPPPDFFHDFGIFVGRIEVQQGLTAISSNSSFDLAFSVNEIPLHNDLQGLQGGNGSGEYYHLSSASYSQIQTGNFGTSSSAPTASFVLSSSISNFSNTSSFAFNTSNSDTASFLQVGTYQITSSWANNATTASFALNNSTITLVTGSTYQITSSNSVSSSWAPTLGLTPGSTQSITASSAVSASWSPNQGATTLVTASTVPITASWSVSSSWSPGQGTTTLYTSSTYQITSSFAEVSSNSVTASYALNSSATTLFTSSTYQITASNAISSSWAPFTDNPNAVSASWASNSVSASYVPNLYPQVNQVNVDSASWVPASVNITTADTASYVLNAISTSYSPVEPAYSSSVSTQFDTRQPNLVIGNTYEITASGAVSASWAPFTDNPNAISASWASQSLSASYVPNLYPQVTQVNVDSASYVPNLYPQTYQVSGSWTSASLSSSWSPDQGATTLITASLYQITASSAISASWAPFTDDPNAVSSSWTSQSLSSSWSPDQGATTLFTASTVPITSSWAVSSEFALNSPATTLFTSSTYEITSSNSVSASYALAALSASWCATGSYFFYNYYNVTQSTTILTSSLFSSQSVFSTQSLYATTSLFAESASWASQSFSSSYVPDLYPQIYQESSSWASSSISASWSPDQGSTTLYTGSAYQITSSNAISSSWSPDQGATTLFTGSIYQITASQATSASWAPDALQIEQISSSWASESISASYTPNLYPQTYQVSGSWTSASLSSSYVPNLYPQIYQDSASWASQSLSASWSPDQGTTTLFTGSTYQITSSVAISASYIPNLYPQTYQPSGSWASSSISASYAPSNYITNIDTASYILNAVSASYVPNLYPQVTQVNVDSASYVPNLYPQTYQSSGSWASSSISASYAPSNHITNADSASYVPNLYPQQDQPSGSWASSSLSSSWSPDQGATTIITGSTYQITSSNSISASWAPFTDNPNAVSASWVPNLYPQIYQTSGSWASQSLSSSWVSNLYPQTYQPSGSWTSQSLSSSWSPDQGATTLYTGSAYQITSSNSISASWAPSNHITNADTASYILNAVSASYSPSNHIVNADSSSYVPNLYPQSFQDSGSWASSSLSSSYAPSNHITNADSASYVPNLYPQIYQASGSWASASFSSSWSPDQGATTLYTGSIYQITSSNSVSASWAPFIDNPNSVSASYVPNLYPQIYQASGSWASASISASYAPSNHIVSADTASFVQNSQSSSWAPSNHITNSDTASYILNAVSSSYAPSNHIVSADSASFVLNAVSASYVSNLYPQTYQPSGSWASSSLSSSWSPNQGATTLFTGSTYQITASSAVSASWAPFTDNPNAVSSSYAGTAGSLNYTVAFATYATSASWASSSISSSWSPNQGATTLFTGSTYKITSSWSNNSITSSFALGIPKIKSGIVAGISFSGNPRIASITFVSSFSDNSYSITVAGEDPKIWTIQNKVSGGFQINSNANQTVSGNTFWQAIQSGEFYS